MGRYIQALKDKICQLRNFSFSKAVLQKVREVKIFPDKQKLMEFKVTRPGFDSKEVLQMKEMKGILDSNSKPHGYKSNIHG